MKEYRGNFTVTFGPYRTRVIFGKPTSGIASFNANIFLGKKSMAWLEGCTVADGTIARLNNIYAEEGISRTQGLRAIGAMLHCFEPVLRKKGVKKAMARTHGTFSRFMARFGYKETARAQTARDVEKQPSRKAIVPRFLQ